MDRQALMNIASRVAHAPSYEARIAELFRATPEETLNRYGLAHYGGTSAFFALAGAFTIGAGIGAGAALLFAPYSGEELRNRLRQRADRLSENVKDATYKAEEKVSKARERVASKVRANQPSQGEQGYGSSPEEVDININAPSGARF